MKKRIKINGFLIFIATMIIAFFPGCFLRKACTLPVDMAITITGVVFLLFGQLIRVSSRGYKAEHSGQGTQLLESGPYGIVRNPMYLGIFFIGFGIILVLFQWWVLALFVAIFILRYVSLTFQEEKKLALVFTSAYQAYCKRVPRLIPSLPTLVKTRLDAYLPLKIAWFKREMRAILPALGGVLLARAWECIRGYSMAVYLKELVGTFTVIAAFLVFVGLLSNRTKRSQ